jgi:DNA-binding NarL/FixJ family response regulator
MEGNGSERQAAPVPEGVGRALRTMVVEPHALMRRALTALLASDPRFEVIAEASDVPEAHRTPDAARPDVILVASSVSWSGLEASVRQLRSRFPDSAVVVTGIEADPGYDDASRTAGADGYVTSDAGADLLMAGVQDAARRRDGVSREQG